ncbi:zinc and cadmium transporter [Natronospira proteinivora]|uniref:Zinc and cadmium transporter n=1 Tax=Natronospira proteinivora TaxID=1807133 RepID=A0ABT1G847_9GAMM|nr:ZIP family metal transporter [Natronospira proteinivora]MCP1727484.1 zinc and cadmium transporter [Natronospira proteinivora]
MIELMQALFLALLAGLTGTLMASLFLLAPGHWRDQSLPLLIGFAVGALLGAAFFELIPHALEELERPDLERVGQVFFLTLIVAFLLEKFLRWRHHQKQADMARPAGTVVLISDAVHKFVDGVVVVAAFLTDPVLGAATALAVIAHEVPHELSALAILLNSGFRRFRAFLLKLLSSLAIVPGGALAWFWLEPMTAVRPFILVVAAALFSYIALVTLIPELQREHRPRVSALQSLAILAGGGVIFLLHHLAH